MLSALTFDISLNKKKIVVTHFEIQFLFPAKVYSINNGSHRFGKFTYKSINQIKKTS